MFHKKKRFRGKKSEEEYLDSNILYEKHKEELKNIQKIYVKNYKSNEKNKLVLSTANSESMTIRSTDCYKNNNKKIDVNFKDIIKIDREKSLVHVGSMINMGKLSNYLFKHELFQNSL